MRIAIAALLVATAAFAIAPARAQVTLLSQSATELSVASAQQVTYTVRTDRPGRLALEVLTGDGDLVRRLLLPDAAAGTHKLGWDGRDDQGRAVPDEAYCVRALLEIAGQTATDDPCQRTGGEVVSGTAAEQSPGGDIVYTLSHPARVLIRVGYKGGAMMRSLSVWRPRPAGRNLQRWNGMDDSGTVAVPAERLALVVSAFRLPEFSVLTTGGSTLDYRAYRLSRGWTERLDVPAADMPVQATERNGLRIARQHHMPRYKDREPRITVTLATKDGQVLPVDAPLPAEVRVSVDLHEDDRWLLQESLYEVAFFVNGDFVSEEENGYVPISWIWNTSRLPRDRNLLTVNLTGFTGRVGTKTLAVRK
jgi:hypothetical protein